MYCHCASAGAATAHSSKHTVVLKFWNAYNDVTETPVMNKVVIPRFEKENPGIKVEDVTLPYNGLEQKFIAASAAGNPPDLMRSDIAWMPQLASEGTLLKSSGQSWYKPLQQGGASRAAVDHQVQGQLLRRTRRHEHPGALLEQGRLRGGRICRSAATLAQLYADAKTLTIPSKNQFGLGVDSTDIWNVGPYVWSSGGNFTNNALTKATAMNGSVTTAALNTLINLAEGRRHRL